MDIPTIAAIATPLGTGGIGIIKISGEKSIGIAKSIFKSLQKKEQTFETHYLYHGYIVNPETQKVVDEVLLTVMHSPRSYTGEDVVEINAHSGFVALKTILEIVINAGAKIATPGEFTKRAFLNGRIDLSQAEAVCDVINAKTERSLENAVAHIRGEMRICIETIRETLLNIFTQIEAVIDFPEEIEFLNINKILSEIETKVYDPILQLIENYQDAHIIRDGLNLTIIGKPNVGKSSLINCLLGKERVIVTSIPGTTRDVIKEELNINGVPIIISDTAGLHKTSDPVEIIGIKKTHEHIHDSDMVLFLIDQSTLLTVADFDIYEKIKDKKTILVINKIDLDSPSGFQIPVSWHFSASIKISALQNRGINKLKSLIAQYTIGEFFENYESKIIPNLRQKIAFEKSLRSVENMKKAFIQNRSPELISIDIKDTLAGIDEVLGVSKDTDVLERIFSNFCIGK